MASATGLEGKITLITGANGALGSAAVNVFSGAGSEVCCRDRSAPGENMEWFDVTDDTQVRQAVEALIAAYGRIDVLLNIVGTWAPQPSVAELPDDTLDRLMRINFRSCFLMSRAVLPVMIENRWGRIVNVGARQALRNTAGNSAYGASKAAVIALTQSIAEEEAAYGVTCNAVVPSTMDTPANRAAMPDADFSSWVKPAHVAEAMAFLCSEAGGNINGAAIPIWNRS